MKLICPKKNSGSVLVAVMFFVLAIAAYMIYYLLMVQNSNQSVARAQRWNAALPIAEAGIEEGMANLNLISITTVSNASTFAPILGRPLNGGSYSVNSGAAGVVATITATGTVTAPVTGDLISRTVRVTAQRQGLFSKGMISMTYIDMKGNGVICDSWNSYDPNQSANGLYSNYHGTNGDIAAVNGVVNLGNHTIDGNLYLGPNSTYSAGPNGGVNGTVYTDWNMQFPDVGLPTPTDTNGNIISWTNAPVAASHTFTNGGYYVIWDTGSITVNPGVKVILDVKATSVNLDTLNIKGGTTNAGTVVMYQESGSLSLGGNGSAGAYNSRPENFVYFGLSGVTQITMSGNSTFVGVIFAPQAAFTLNGGGNNNNFIGSILVKSITINGQFNLHYDDSLVGYYYGYYAVGSWQEL